VAAGQQRAKAVLDNWAAAVSASGGAPAVVPVGDLTGTTGVWEMPFGDNAKQALMAGMVLTESGLDVPHPATAEVVWSDGRTATVPVMAAQDALAAIGRAATSDQRCGECQPLIAVSAALTTGPIQTTRGPATAPVWEFTIRGTSVKVTRVAIANALAAPALADASGTVVAIDSAQAANGGTAVTVRFVGAPDPASEPCGEDYTADAVESDLAVTVLVWRHPHVGLPGACALVGAYRTAVATLVKPLGERPLLDPATGQPVTLTLTP
jgi:hypothetical protein